MVRIVVKQCRGSVPLLSVTEMIMNRNVPTVSFRHYGTAVTEEE